MRVYTSVQTAFFQHLQEDPTLLSFIQEHGGIGLTFIDLNHPTYEWSNPGFWESLGLKADHIEDHAFTRLSYLQSPPVDLPLSDSQSFCYHTITHEEVHLMAHPKTLYDEWGKACFQLWVHTLVSPVQAGKKEVDWQSEVDFLNVVGQAVIAFDQDMRIVCWNAAAEEIYGWSAHEMIGTHQGHLIIPENHEEEARNTMSDLFDKGRWEGEFLGRHKNGRTFPTWVSNRLITDNEGQIKGCIGVSSEISELKRTQSRLHETTKILELVAESAKLGIWEWDLVDEQATWNDRMFSIYGITRQEWEVDPTIWKALVHPDDQNQTQALCGDIPEDGVIQDVNFRILTPAGQLKHIYACGTSVKDEKGQIVKVVGVNMDISRLTDLEKAEALAQKLAIKNKEIEHFAYIASHDLQEPIRTIRSYVELLERSYKDQLGEEAEIMMQFIVDASSRMRMLIKGLMDYSRLGRSDVQQEIDCDQLVTEVLADLEATISHHHAGITLSYLPSVKGYLVELRMLFQNLISNALKFHHPDRQPSITIGGKTAGTYHLFWIKDNGIGIPLKYQEQIFKIFHRLHNRESYDGIGIGLAYCQKIVELHNGKIWVDSEPGQGSTFFVQLPNR